MSEEPVYWFQKYWQREIYQIGIEVIVREFENDIPIYDVEDHFGMEENKFVEWRPRLVCQSFDFGSVIIKGYVLFAKEKLSDGKLCFVPIIEVVNDEAGRTKLIARKNFTAGDVVTFLSEWEILNRKIGLGGACARTVDNVVDSNTYLTKYGILRCTKNIRRGEEIIRLDSKMVDKRMERIDRLAVYISCGEVVCGRIGPEIVPVGDDDTVRVHFADGTSATYLEGREVGLVTKRPYT